MIMISKLLLMVMNMMRKMLLRTDSMALSIHDENDNEVTQTEKNEIV